jgi:hypothetical protein
MAAFLIIPTGTRKVARATEQVSELPLDHCFKYI